MPIPLASSSLSSPSVRPRVQTRSRLKRPFSQDEVADFRRICSQQTNPEDFPYSANVVKNAVVYSGSALLRIIRDDFASGSTRKSDAVMDEMHRCLLSGPGIFVVKGCIDDPSVIDRTNKVFQRIIEQERAGGPKSDHFAASGANDRIWNSFQKHAVLDSESFVSYYSNEVLALACEAWLGPGYQITAQTNIVKPGGKAQDPHRDYHLGFQSEEIASRFPIPSQIASQLLTLQLAIAHSDMPLDSGPTKLLPYSQQFEYGYTAYRHPEFVEIFDELMIQVELEKGDAVFFNPALFHAAGANTTEDFHRIANLLQVSACWSRPMETVNHNLIIRSTWESVLHWMSTAEGGPNAPSSQALIRAITDGYSFPSNLDRDPPPLRGHCPETQRDMVERAAQESLSLSRLNSWLDDYTYKHQA